MPTTLGPAMSRASVLQRVRRLMEQDLKDAKYVKSVRTSWKQATAGELYNWKEILPDPAR